MYKKEIVSLFRDIKIRIDKTKFALLYTILLVFLTNCNPKTKTKEELKKAQTDAYDTSELTIQRGMEAYNKQCASCHNFNENAIGPNLANITSQVPKAWLKAFIKNPKKMIESGDERAVKHFDKYKVYMPSFDAINEEELEAILGFVHKYSEAEKKNQNKRAGGILNPIPQKIPEAEMTLIIEEYLTIPASAKTAPLARINKLSAFKSKSGERLFIGDLRGKLYEIIENAPQVYLDLRDEVTNFTDYPGWGTGLGSFDFHPEFKQNGLLYTTHTEPAGTTRADFDFHDSIPVGIQWVLTEWKTKNPQAKMFSGKRRELLRVDMVSSAHGFQELSFNPLAQPGDPDYGLLYLCMGDGAAALAGYSFLCDSPANIWGSVIRINPLGNSSINGKYGIPTDNPYVNEEEKLDEIWSHGFRNAHRISWDKNGSGKVFVTNIGQHSLEEINLLKKGANYGWPKREGTFLYDVNANTEIVYPLPHDDSGYTYPVIQFDHDEGNAVSGGYAYAGNKIPLLKNKYLFGDIPRGTLFYSNVADLIEGKQAPIYKIDVELNAVKTSFGKLSDAQRVDLRFGEDSDGELFIFTKSNGKVYKVIECKTTIKQHRQNALP